MRDLAYLAMYPWSAPTAFESADMSCSMVKSDPGCFVIMGQVEVCGAASAGLLNSRPRLIFSETCGGRCFGVREEWVGDALKYEGYIYQWQNGRGAWCRSQWQVGQ